MFQMRAAGKTVAADHKNVFTDCLNYTQFHGLKYSSAKQSSAICQNAEKPQSI